MLIRLWALALRWLQRRCSHRPEWVLADAHEGDLRDGTRVRWCRACGAMAIVHSDGRKPSLRLPEPTWCLDVGDTK